MGRTPGPGVPSADDAPVGLLAPCRMQTLLFRQDSPGFRLPTTWTRSRRHTVKKTRLFSRRSRYYVPMQRRASTGWAEVDTPAESVLPGLRLRKEFGTRDGTGQTAFVPCVQGSVDGWLVCCCRSGTWFGLRGLRTRNPSTYAGKRVCPSHSAGALPLRNIFAPVSPCSVVLP